MALSFNFNFKSKPTVDDRPILEKPFFEKDTDQFKKDLAARNGGLQIGRQGDQQKIDAITGQIKAGGLSEEEIDRWIHRNPGARALFATARQNFKNTQKLNEITQRALRPAQPAFEAQGPVRPGEAQPFGQAQPAAFNEQQALTEAVQANVLTPAFRTRISGLASSFAPPKDESLGRGGRFSGVKVSADGKHLIALDKVTQKVKSFPLPKGLTVDVPTVKTTRFDEAGREITTVQSRRDLKGPVAAVNPLSAFEPQIKNLSKQSTAALLPQLIAPVKVLDRIISKFDADELKSPGSGKIAGLGNLKNLKVSRFLQSRAGARFRGAIQSIENIKIKQLSGTAVTQFEELRLAIESARGVANTGADFILAWKERIRPALANLASAIKQSADPQAVQMFESRGKFKFSDFDTPKPPSGGGKFEFLGFE